MKKLGFAFIFIFTFQARAEEMMTAMAVAVNESTPATAVSPAEPEVKIAETKSEVKDESQIPLKMTAEKKDEASASSLGRFLFGSVILTIILAGVYFLIRKYSMRNPKVDSHQIKILTQHHLGPRKSLAIIRVAGESVLIGVTDHNISMIKSLSLLDEDIPQDTPKKFDQALFQVEKKSDEEFTIKGIHEHVRSKLKEMKGFS